MKREDGVPKLGLTVGTIGKDNRMSIEKCVLAPLELMRLAKKVGMLTSQTWEEPIAYRASGRIHRDSNELRAASKAIVDGVKRRMPFFLEFAEGPNGFALLQISMEIASRTLWEELWNQAYPDRFGHGWNENDEDLVLTSVWRDKVRAMFTDCRQHSVLAMCLEEYFAKLIGAGVTEEDAQQITDWFCEITAGDTPGSTQVVMEEEK
jgi:hypothetical protein